MARYQNPFVQGPWNSGPSVGSGIGSIAKLFAPDAGDLAGLANARLNTARAVGVEATNQGWDQVIAGRQNARANDPESMRNMTLDMLLTRDPQAMAAVGAFNRALGGAAGVPGPRMDQLALGAGTAYGNTQAGARMEDATRRYGFDSSAGATRYSADTSAAAARYGVDQREAGADRRAAVPVPQNTDVYLPSNHPIFNGRRANGVNAPPLADPNFVLEAPQSGPVRLSGRQRTDSLTQQQGEILSRLAQPDVPEEERQRLEALLPAGTVLGQRERDAAAAARLDTQGRQRVEQIQIQGQQATELQTLRGAQASGRLDVQGQQRLQQLEVQNAAALERAQLAIDNRPPPDITPAEMEKMRETMLGLLGDTVDGGKPTGATQVSPEAQSWLQQRASQLYQQTRNSGAAAAQAVEEFRRAWQAENPRVAIPRADQTQGWFARDRVQMGLPRNLPRGGSPATGAGGATQSQQGAAPEGTEIEMQDGRRMIKRGGQWVPAS